MNSEPCDGFFTDSMVAASLPPQVFAKYQEALAKDAVKAASVELCTCHQCSFQAEMADDAGSVMVCPACNSKTCMYVYAYIYSCISTQIHICINLCICECMYTLTD